MMTGIMISCQTARCDLLDDDNNGHLSLAEMLQGFDSNEKFWMLMQHFDISRWGGSKGNSTLFCFEQIMTQNIGFQN